MSSITDIPKVAWKRRLNQTLDEPGRPKRVPLDILLKLLPAILRLRWHVARTLKDEREVMDNPFNPLNPGPVMGVPLGGLGGGTITRGWRGDFVRFQMRPGLYQYGMVDADQFSLFVRHQGERGRVTVLRAGRPESGALAGWDWNLDPKRATYYALYPRAWTVYEDPLPGITLTCRQVSPFIPHNYEDSATPAGVFVYTIHNTGSKPATVGLMFTFQNGIGATRPFVGVPGDRAGGHTNHSFRLDAEGGEVVGVALRHLDKHRLPKPIRELVGHDDYEDPLTFAIAAQARPGVQITYRSRFVTTSSAMDVWGDFREDGRLEDHDDPRPSTVGMAIGAALAATVEVPPGETREVAFALAWDMPLARFGDGTAWFRRYTRFYGRDGNAAPAIARDALLKYPRWEEAIAAWQQPILDQTGLPDWYKTALFNELYYLADGGTVWTDGPPLVPQKDDAPALDRPSPVVDAPDAAGMGHFGYLEGHEYRMINTYDVHFYASFALASLFPELELSLQRDVARAVEIEDAEQRRMMYSGKVVMRKARGAVPHDLGAPTEDPWFKVNAYNWQDTRYWKDLNPMFALQVARDFALTGNREFAASLWKTVREAMEYAAAFDLDEDGLIENERTPDTTFDAWEMDGPGAYVGGLWLAALAATAWLAETLGHAEDARRYREMLERAQATYQEELWNEEYYDFDSSGGYRASAIMAAQMVGQWYARACGLDPVVPPECARSALKKVYEFNVKQFEDGEIGAVNGMLPDGRVDTSALQSQEVWTGMTYALAAAMLYEGLIDEAWETARGIYNGTYREFGYWFATPEAWDVAGDFRALAYMRPLAIWAMQWAWERRE